MLEIIQQIEPTLLKKMEVKNRLSSNEMNEI